MTEGKTRNYQLKLQHERFRLNVMIVKNWHGLLRLAVEWFRATQDTSLSNGCSLLPEDRRMD